MACGKVMAIAHRGASAYAPENTVTAFREALRRGCRAIEFEVRLTREGVAVAVHDATLERTTDGQGLVADKTLTELRELDAGSWVGPQFADCRIPTLEEALAVISSGGGWPVINLQTPVPPSVLEGMLREHQLLSQAVVMSGEAEWLAPVRRQNRDLGIGLLADRWSESLPQRAALLGAQVVILDVDVMSLGHVAAVENQGLDVWCATANDIGLVAACAAMGARGIITDYPDLIRDKDV